MSGQYILNKYFRKEEMFPHIWCPGCGNGTIMKASAQAIDNLNLDNDDIIVVSGIGCSSRAPGYMNFDTLHTLHGRAIAYASGVKMTKPEKKVVVMTGDGDCTAIGGNHFIHAARRNMDMTVVIYNNNIYGMTGGQYSPTTPTGDKSTTTSYGNVDRVFDILKLAEGAGATFTARSTVYHTKHMTQMIQDALEHKGFSVVEVIANCHTYYGRKNKKGGAVEMLNMYKDTTVDIKVADKLPKEKVEGKILIGQFTKIDNPEYTEEYAKIKKSK